MGVKKKSNSSSSKSKNNSKISRKRQGNIIFSLDIGTRTVVGILAKMVDGAFTILDFISIPHSKRAMSDGQIEEIGEVAKIVGMVKSELENRHNIRLSHVCIAAAGRALKTQRVKIDMEVPTSDAISSDIEKTVEIEAVSKAQEIIDKSQSAEDVTAYYCVGHSVVEYQLDGYPMKSIVGHKGKIISVEVVAAFLPNIVVESLYAVTDINKLSVASLTLEPIAAMNVIIPPEIRLINIALVDIGAGTSDIAISKDGSIVAYAMATIAGDEITEDIIKKYLVSFETAENMKFSAKSDEIVYKDILGIEHTINAGDFFKSIYPVVENLADTIVKNILEVNGSAPSAVFLVGGGSQIPDLANIIAKKLEIPEARVAVGGHNFIKNVVIGGNEITGPEFVTPIGIGVTSTIQSGYDFSTITLNGKKYRVFDTRNMNILDLLMTAGYKTRHIIGHSGKSLSFTLNGEKQVFKGEIAKPAQLFLNDEPASIEKKIKQGDIVRIIPATTGISADVYISDIAGDAVDKYCTLNGERYSFGTKAFVNGVKVDSSYKIQNNDIVTITSVSKLSELLEQIGFIPDGYKFQKGKAVVSTDIFLEDGDNITAYRIAEKPAFVEMSNVNVSSVKNVSNIPEQVDDKKPVEDIPPPPPIKATTTSMRIILNGNEIILPEKEDTSPHIFLEVLSFVSLDLSSPQGELIMLINGNNATYTSRLCENDRVDIMWK